MFMYENGNNFSGNSNKFRNYKLKYLFQKGPTTYLRQFFVRLFNAVWCLAGLP